MPIPFFIRIIRASQKTEFYFVFIRPSRTTILKLRKALKALDVATNALEKISKHGCCVMHGDSGCPGCESVKALAEIRGGK